MTFEELMAKHELKPYCWSGVGDGWLTLLDKLITKLKSMGWNGEIGQIKEKFGELRFYADNTTNEMEDVINEYTKLSITVCETCGEPGSLRGGGWIYTSCDKCDRSKNNPK